MHISSFQVFLQTLLSAHLAAAQWSIAFYTGETCNNDASFNNTNYLGDHKSTCLLAGENAHYCTWHTENGQNAHLCTAPMDPPPASFRFAQGGQCIVSWSESCEVANWPGSEDDELVSNTCYKTSELPGGKGSAIGFQCWMLSD
ncbi:hypothetical protein AC578_3399 [Pseudocercospora eumusae]|uniref:Uncharacterized protein n=1 Tax=Pseudocercospora eumusae TaxID=321146 RepID=A0A139H642_9PEZI|nr:hypothetical protein AC578_3399 [Pseudocercospora eumusae]KXS97945.1 hypothetical protein AC578_3399 [Pseudocercospora eumusae]